MADTAEDAMTEAEVAALLDRVWSDGEMVGTSCLELDAYTVRDAIELGGAGGALYLARRQAEDIGSPARIHDTPVVVIETRTINAGADWLGVYDGPTMVVGICSRAGAGRFGRRL